MKRTIGIISTSGAIMLGVAACGGSSSPAPAANAGVTAAPSAGASNAAGGTGAARGGANRGALAGIAAELPQIKTCLDAAGISTADLPTAIPTGRPSGAPRPSFNPSDRPTSRPSGGFGAGGGRNAGLFSIFSNQADITALKACGITVPTFAGRGAGGGAPGAGAPGGVAATGVPTT